MERILVIRMGAMGDIVHTMPAVASLRRAFPLAEIDWLVERHWAPLLECYPHISRLQVIDTSSWRKAALSPATWRAIAAAVGQLEERRYGLVIDFQGLLKSAVLARATGAPHILGFDTPQLREPAAGVFYTHRVLPPPAFHVVEHNLALAAAAGARERVIEFCCLASPEDAASARHAVSPAGRYALLSPSAGWVAKRWPEESYAEVATRLARELGVAVVINCGPGDDEVAGRVASLAAETRPLLLRPSLRELIALVRDAALVIAGDTGPTHLAAACGTPVVAIFGPTDPRRNGPYAPASTARVLRSAGASTDYSRSAARDAVADVSVDEVMQAAAELLSTDQP